MPGIMLNAREKSSCIRSYFLIISYYNFRHVFCKKLLDPEVKIRTNTEFHHSTTFNNEFVSVIFRV